MKPYQLIKPDGEWVDLSAIQSIEPPVYTVQMDKDGFFAVMRWRVAFQDNPRELRWEQEFDLDQQKDNGSGHSPKVDEHGVPTALARMRRQVFEPFLKAWSEQ
jgi:hypothetical protein